MSFWGKFVRRNYVSLLLGFQVFVDLAVMQLACWTAFWVGGRMGSVGLGDGYGSYIQLYTQVFSLQIMVCLVNFALFGLYLDAFHIAAKRYVNVWDFEAVGKMLAKSVLTSFFVFFTLLLLLQETTASTDVKDSVHWAVIWLHQISALVDLPFGSDSPSRITVILAFVFIFVFTMVSRFLSFKLIQRLHTQGVMNSIVKLNEEGLWVWRPRFGGEAVASPRSVRTRPRLLQRDEEGPWEWRPRFGGEAVASPRSDPPKASSEAEDGELDESSQGQEPSPLEDVLNKLEGHLEGGGFFDNSAGSAGASEDMQWGGEVSAGTVLGDFRLIKPLGRGGMGQVWEAEELSIQRRVALKLLHPHVEISSKGVDRFQREAQAGGRLAHPGIVQVFSTGIFDGRHYMAQELVIGNGTLADSLNGFRLKEEIPNGYYRQMALFFSKVGVALAHAHDQGVIHRDIKPSNLLIGADDQPKVADFGLARMESQFSLSHTGELLGTPFYMSPEQAAIERKGIDHRTDIFSLGATLYEALTLTRPFNGDTSHQVLQQILMMEPLDPREIRSGVPHGLVVICQRAMEKRPADRYPSMAALVEDLNRFLSGHLLEAQPHSVLRRYLKWVEAVREKVLTPILFTIIFTFLLLPALLVLILLSLGGLFASFRDL